MILMNLRLFENVVILVNLVSLLIPMIFYSGEYCILGEGGD